MVPIRTFTDDDSGGDFVLQMLLGIFVNELLTKTKTCNLF